MIIKLECVTIGPIAILHLILMNRYRASHRFGMGVDRLRDYALAELQLEHPVSLGREI